MVAIFGDGRQMMLVRLLRCLGDFCVQGFFKLCSFESTKELNAIDKEAARAFWTGAEAGFCSDSRGGAGGLAGAGTGGLRIQPADRFRP
ncbi:MAG TPA: hypothetical protein PLH50_12615, partial [Ottowia beijingensis]|nr:hypothetical protein [Ottowia beijingensis]